MLSKLLVNDLKIFSTTRLAGNNFPFSSSWFATVSTRVMYSFIYCLCSIFMFSNRVLRVWTQTCLTRLPLLYAFSRISHAFLEDAAFVIFSKSDLSATLYNTYNAYLSFTCKFFNAQQSGLLPALHSLVLGYPSHTFEDSRRAFISKL